MSEVERTSEHSGWISPVDYEASGMAVREMMFENGDVNLAMNAIIREQRTIDEASYRELSVLGSYMIPLDPNGKISDDTTKFEVYMVGMNLALASLDALCDSLNINIDIDEFRRVWREQGLTLVLNLNDERVRAQSPQEQYESVGQGIMEHGYRAMDDLGQAYDSLLDTATDHFPSVGANPGILKASFGYILSGGLRSLNAMVEEREFQQLFMLSDVDEASDSVDTAARSAEAIPAYRSIDHATIAEELDTIIFYGETPAEEYLGRLTQAQLDIDERPIEILNTLALVAQPNELGNFALDEAGEAFFYASVLALDIISKHAKACGVDRQSMVKSWRKQHAHGKAYAIESPDDPVVEDINEHIVRILNRADLTDAYDGLLVKLADKLGYDEEQAIAAANGFHYMLLTGTDALKSAVNQAIGETVKDEMLSFEAELARLLEG